MDVTVSELMANFLDSPLVVWVKTFGPLGTGSEDNLAMFMELVDGIFLHKIMTHIDPSPSNLRVNKNVNNNVNLRIQNLNIIVRHIKNYYQDCLQQLIVMNLPDVLTISNDPLSGKSMEEMKRLILLILGCAVQCERKEEFIEKIKQLDIETQAGIVTHIQEVTHNQENVFDLQWLEVGDLPAEDLDSLARNMAIHLRKLIDDRDDRAEVIVELSQERDYLLSQQPPSPTQTSCIRRQTQDGPITLLCREDPQHLAVELADSKAKLRCARQDLEEKTEQLIDAKTEIERLDTLTQKLKQENSKLSVDARSMRAYQDELDALRERAARVDRLETELGRCRERLHDVTFYKTRVEELQEDKRTLIETKIILEEQLMGARSRCDKLHELEKENLQLRSKMHDMEMDRDTYKKRIEELVEENMLLEISQKQSMNESAHLGWELDQLSKNNDINEACKSFGFELNESTSSQLLKLEKENQSLQNTIQELREASLSMEESQLCALELEKENQGLSKKILELEQEKECLSQTVTLLRQRAQADGEARIREVEQENRALHQAISDTGGQLARLETEKRETAKELVRLRERAEWVKELESDAARLENAHEQLQKQLSSLTIVANRAEALERENADLEQDNRRLKKLADAAQNTALRLDALEKDRRQLDEENLELRQTVETLRPAAAKVPHLQQENRELEQEREELARAVDKLSSLGKKADRVELSCQSLSSENQQLQRSLDDRSMKVQELERELRGVEVEGQLLRRCLEEQRAAAKCMEGVEKEMRGVELQLAQSEKERKQLEKEVRRLRQQLEAKEAALEESLLGVACLEKDGRVLEKELSSLKEAAGKVKELERENKELQKQATIDKRTLATLREDLVNEKLKGQQKWNELEKLNQELEKIGLNRERLLQEEHDYEDNKYKILETKIESTLKKTLEIREEKIHGLESRLEESSSLNQHLRTELTTVKRSLEALRQRQEEEEAHRCSLVGTARPGSLSPSQEKWETEEREARVELHKLKDRLIDIEKINAALLTEKLLQKEQLRQTDAQNAQLNAQVLALQRQAAALQEHNTALHMQMAKLQVENSTLSSQSASLMGQNAMLQGQVQTLEGDMEALQCQQEMVQTAQESTLKDHGHLLAVHERQSGEFEQLIAQHATLKGNHRTLEQEHRSLESKYRVLMTQTAAVEELESALCREKENLGEEIRKKSLILGENQNLRGEVERLKQMHTCLKQEYDGLQLHTKELKTSLNETQLEVNRWQARYDQLKEQHQGLDISLTKMNNHCELLTRLKGNLEEENHHLISQIQMLSQQNQTLLERTMESKELYHEEQKQYIDKLNALRRQKEKLEEKIMDQYKFYDPAPKKRSHWVGAKALTKFMKPKKELSQERVRNSIELPPSLPLPTPASDTAEGQQPVLSCLRQESVGSHSMENSPTNFSDVTPSRVAKVLNDGSGLQGGDLYRSLGCSSESLNSLEEMLSRRRCIGLGTLARSTSAIHITPTDTTVNSSPGTRTQGSLSSDDIIIPSHDMSAYPAPATPDSPQSHPRLPSLLAPPYDTVQLKRVGCLFRRHPSSPGSEMVTLEEFLQESKSLSPPAVQVRTDCRNVSDSLCTGYPMSQRDGAKTPTSYVTPTVKATPLGDFVEAKTPNAGQNVKPKLWALERAQPPSVMSTRHSHTLPSGAASGNKRTSPNSGPRGAGSLSRTCSLASADLLCSSGPNSYSDENQGDVVLRVGTVAQERPQSSRLAGLSPIPVEVGYYPLDPHRLSLTPPKDDSLLKPSLPPPKHHSSSLSLFASPLSTRSVGQLSVGQGRPASLHRVEVAMVPPVQAAPAPKDEEWAEFKEAGQTNSPQLKMQETVVNYGLEEPTTSTPPDPNNDPQTVWYEYGCV